MGIAALIIAATIVGGQDSGVSEAAHYAAAALLVALATDGAHRRPNPGDLVRDLPVLLSASAALLVVAGLL